MLHSFFYGPLININNESIYDFNVSHIIHIYLRILVVNWIWLFLILFASINIRNYSKILSFPTFSLEIGLSFFFF